MPVPIAAAGPLLWVGDSITALGNYWWPAVSGGLIDQINAQFVTPAPAPRIATSTGAVATSTGAAAVVQNSTSPTKVLNYKIDINIAQSGFTTANIDAGIAAAMATYNPAVVVMLIGINDILTAVAPATTQANLTSIIGKIHSANASCQIILLSLLAHNEPWDNVTGWSPGPNADDASIASANTYLAGLATANPTYITYADVRTPLLAAERISNVAPVVGNTVGVDSGVYTDSTPPAGIHPLTNLKLLMATAVLAKMTVVP